MISGKIKYLLIILLIGKSFHLFSQSGNPEVEGIRSYFVKPDMNMEVGQLAFNILRVVNTGSNPITIKPTLQVPKGFTTFNTSFSETNIPVGDSMSFPFRLRITNEASSNKMHDISFRLFDSKNKLIHEDILSVQPLEVHDWDIEIPTNGAFFYPRFNLAEFSIKIKNDGNTSELINLDIRPDKNLNLKGQDGSKWQESHLVYMQPNTDTIIFFRASYSGDKNRIYDVARVNINAIVGETKIYKAITIEKYSDEYDPFFVDYTLPYEVEVGVRSGNFNSQYSPFINTRGYSEFKNQSTFKYYYSNYSLNNPENFLENSNYRFLYSKDRFQVGLGNFSSQLGRNLFSRNALMLAYGLEIGKTNLIEGYASQDYVDPITSVAAGYKFENKNWNLKSSAGYNYDGLRKINTTSIIGITNQIPLFKGHSLSAIIDAYRQDYYQVNPYTLQGIGWEIVWFGRAGSRFNYQLRNSYGSPKMPGTQMGILGFGGKMALQTFATRKYWTSEIFITRRNYNEYNLLGEQSPDIFLSDSYANILYNSHSNPNFTYSVGPSIELYNSKRPSLQDYAYEEYNLKKFHIEAKLVIHKSFGISIIGGMRDIIYIGNTILDDTKPDFHLTADYSKNGYGIRLNYNYGPMVSRGLYQYPSDIFYNGIIISPFLLKSYLKDRLKVQIFTSFNYREDLNFYYANIAPGIELYLAKNWYLKARGNYSYYRQNNEEYISENSNYYAQVSIKKKFGKSNFHNKEKDLKRLKVICFKDENNNGKKDGREKGIEMIKVRMKLVDEANQPGHANFPIDIALLTNDKGNVIFNRIPKGFYQLEVDPLGNMQEYFYVSEEYEYVELIKNTTFYIPFQKANRIVGHIALEKTKYSDENPLDLENIKITAYNQMGNSYSSFTLKDGSFTLFAPGDTVYYIRLNNVFSNKYKVVQNDIMKRVPDLTNTPVIFSVVEKTRKINFKKAPKKQQGSESLKIKVLEGKIHENDRVSKTDEPDFGIGGGTSFEIDLIVGKHYVILAKAETKDEALEATFNTMDKGIDAYFGYDASSKKYFVILGEYNSAFDAQSAAQQARDAGISAVETLFYK